MTDAAAFDPSDCAFCCIAVRPLPNGAAPGCPVHGTAATGVKPAPTVGEVVSASRVLLNALLYQPGQTADVVEARRLVDKAIDRYDRNQPGDAVTATHTFPEQVQDFRSRFSRLLHASTVNGVFSCDVAGDINKIAAIAALVADEEFFDGIRRPPRNARS